MYEEKEIKYKKIKRKNSNEKNKKAKFINSKPIKSKSIKKPSSKKNIENNFLSKIDWKNIIIKLLLLAILMLLIIFITSRISNIEEKEEYSYDKNFEKIANSVVSYYETYNKPQNIGENDTLLLGELINVKVLDKVLDENNKNCDYLNSYTNLTKIDENIYSLKVYLKCNKHDEKKEFEIDCSTEKCSIKK